MLVSFQDNIVNINIVGGDEKLNKIMLKQASSDR